jgi:oligoendopeptidase F
LPTSLFASLPHTYPEFQDWSWTLIEPFYQDLSSRMLDASALEPWLLDWNRLQELIYERYNRLYAAITCDTTDREAELRFYAFLDEIFPHVQTAENGLKMKLLSSGLEPEGYEITLRNLRAEVALFQPDNLTLLAEERKLNSEYDKIIGAQTVTWEGQELTLAQILPIYYNPDRNLREKAWRLAATRQLEDRQALNDLWKKLLQIRRALATKASQANYRNYRWQQLLRFDYTPEDCYRMHEAIEEVVIPAALRVYEKRSKRLGVDRLRPWDLNVEPLNPTPLRPFSHISDLENKAEAIFQRIDPQLGQYFALMRQEKLLDLDNRIGKAPGGYCTSFPAARRPFIFMNSVGVQNDVETILHEAGHAFHVFETQSLPFLQQEAGLEFAEVASMTMELLASPFLTLEEGGFYTQAEAARVRIAHLEREFILFWPYMAVVDAFQHWAYKNPAKAADPAHCDDQWSMLWIQFMQGVDWSGLEEEMATGWHRKQHIFQDPFYYIEYGLASLGAVQVWRNALQEPERGVAMYRSALSLGGSRSLPELYAAAGAKFSFDANAFQQEIDFIEKTIDSLEKIALSE